MKAGARARGAEIWQKSARVCATLLAGGGPPPHTHTSPSAHAPPPPNTHPHTFPSTSPQAGAHGEGGAASLRSLRVTSPSRSPAPAPPRLARATAARPAAERASTRRRQGRGHQAREVGGDKWLEGASRGVGRRALLVRLFGGPTAALRGAAERAANTTRAPRSARAHVRCRRAAAGCHRQQRQPLDPRGGRWKHLP